MPILPIVYIQPTFRVPVLKKATFTIGIISLMVVDEEKVKL